MLPVRRGIQPGEDGPRRPDDEEDPTDVGQDLHGVEEAKGVEGLEPQNGHDVEIAEQRSIWFGGIDSDVLSVIESTSSNERRQVSIGVTASIPHSGSD